MYCFKLNNGQVINKVQIDGYIIAGLVLEGIEIDISFTSTGKISSSINKKNKKSLEGIEYEGYLEEAKRIATDYIKNKDLDLFLCQSSNVIDIIDELGKSYYRSLIPTSKSIIHIKMNAICSEVILKEVERKNKKILIS